MLELIKKLKIEAEYAKVMELKNAIPDDGNISGDQASVLQTKCWLVTMDLTKAICRAEKYFCEVKHAKDRIYGDKRAECQEKTEEAKKRYAYAHTDYQDLSIEAGIAETLVNNLNNLKKFFDNGVYVMRSRQDKEKRDWQSTPTTEV